MYNNMTAITADNSVFHLSVFSKVSSEGFLIGGACFTLLFVSLKELEEGKSGRCVCKWEVKEKRLVNKGVPCYT